MFHTRFYFRSLATLRYFTHLKTLILDNNSLDVSAIPKLMLSV